MTNVKLEGSDLKEWLQYYKDHHDERGCIKYLSETAGITRQQTRRILIREKVYIPKATKPKKPAIETQEEIQEHIEFFDNLSKDLGKTIEKNKETLKDLESLHPPKPPKPPKTPKKTKFDIILDKLEYLEQKIDSLESKNALNDQDLEVLETVRKSYTSQYRNKSPTRVKQATMLFDKVKGMTPNKMALLSELKDFHENGNLAPVDAAWRSKLSSKDLEKLAEKANNTHFISKPKK